MSFRWLLPCLALGSAAASPPSLVVAFQGRADAEASAYDELLAALQREGEERKVEIFYPKKGTFQEMEPEVQELMAQHPGAFLVYMGHGMGATGGASAAQHYAATAATAAKARLVLLAGFLERVWRPDIAACMKTWSVQPTLKCPKGLCPGGYLKDGVHNCSGPTIPSPSYPGPPSLSIGGELDGLVRMSRMAEAWYTQQATQHKVKLVLGMSHSDLMSSIPSSVAAQDLPSECGASDARTQVSKLILDFLLAESLEISPEAEIFGPFVEMFAKEEGSWWWTSYSDEQGSSSWAANAQRRLVDPLPCSGASGAWHVENEFHLLSDEGLIPPYYRPKHRPNLTKDDGGFLRSLTVAQLRYVELSVLQVAAGLNGWAVIKEEKAGVLADRKMAIKDDGGNPTSAIEIGTKLVSREAAFKACGAQTSPSLDQGDRCKSINQDAYQLALNVSSQRALSRFQRLGRPLVMAADKKPTPPAGPWWIWNYLSYTDKSSEVEVASWYAFYPLSGPAYGAGNHYCKLLSPARALEWIYIDGLRKAPKNVNEVNVSVVV